MLLAYWSAFLPIDDGKFGQVIDDLRVFCLGWDPQTGTYRLDELFMVLLPAPVLMGMVAVVWPSETIDAFRRLGRSVSSRTGMAVIAVIVLVSVVGATGVGWKRSSIAGIQRGFETAPDFSLTDSSGASFSLNDLRGKPVLLTFTYSNCQSICPNILKRTDKAMAISGVGDVRAVSVTVDPERDTPERLREAMKALQIKPERWNFVTGAPADVDSVLKKYLVGRQRDPVTGMVSHSNALVIIDREGRMAYRVDPLDTEVGNIAELLRKLGG